MAVFERLIRALGAFLRVWYRSGDCNHARVDITKGTCYCPDCGYKVKVTWNLLSCRRCNARRLPKASVFGPVQPKELFCKHCGYDQVQLIKKDHIEAYELPFAVSELQTEFDEASVRWQPTHKWQRVQTPQGPTHASPVEIEILNKQEFTGSRRAYKQYAQHWHQPHTHQWHQGGQPTSASDLKKPKVNPILKSQWLLQS